MDMTDFFGRKALCVLTPASLLFRDQCFCTGLRKSQRGSQRGSGRLHNRKRKQGQLPWYLSSTFASASFLGGGDTMFDVTMFVETFHAHRTNTTKYARRFVSLVPIP